MQQQLAVENAWIFQGIMKLMSSSQRQANIMVLELVIKALEPRTATPGPNVIGNRTVPAVHDFHVRKMTITGDPEEYLNAFEMMATMEGWERAMWAAVLKPYLIGVAQEAVQKLSIANLNDYDTLRASIMKTLNPTPEVYCRRLWEIEFGPPYQPWAIGQQIRVVGRVWLRTESMTKEQIVEAVLVEHFTPILPFNPKSWLLCPQPAKLEEAVIMMEAYACIDAGLHLSKELEA